MRQPAVTLARTVNRVGLYWRTLRHLKAIQIVNRIQRRLMTPALPDKPNAPAARAFGQTGFIPQTNASILAPTRFQFLNRTVDLDFPTGWNDASQPVLWLYNLHYFDGLAHEGTPQDVKRDLIQRWVSDNPGPHGTGWEPYPLSLRIVNWVKWGWQAEALPTAVRASLWQQIEFLERTLEYHLLGNHLLENAKALVFGGLYFSGEVADQWLEKGVRILDRQLREQILADGAHFELSPMYHSIMLELVIDMVCLAQNRDCPEVLRARGPRLEAIARSMAKWLRQATHTDGEISFFNDGAIGIAKTPQTLIKFVESLTGNAINLNDAAVVTGASGLVRLAHQQALVFFDAAAVGPTYLPGHAHADTLSLEASFFGQRVFVNVGTSEYGLSPRREYERSTAAHSTLTLDGQNSSETWAGFRVGRRARVQNLKIIEDGDTLSVSATHDGYRHLPGRPVHRRTIILGPGRKMQVSDHVTRAGFDAIVRYHLHPDVNTTVDPDGSSGRMELGSGEVLTWRSSAGAAHLEEFQYAPSFGVLKPSKSLVLAGRDQTDTMLTLEW